MCGDDDRVSQQRDYWRVYLAHGIEKMLANIAPRVDGAAGMRVRIPLRPTSDEPRECTVGCVHDKGMSVIHVYRTPHS